MTKRTASITIYDIAAAAGVSPKTVSRVLNRNPQVGADLRDRVERAIQDLGYAPNPAARSLKGPRGYTLALLLDQAFSRLPDDEGWHIFPFIGALEAAALRTAQQRGYRFRIEGLNPDMQDIAAALLALQRSHIDGVMLIAPNCDHLPLLEALAARNMPFVRLSPGVECELGASLFIDEAEGAKVATQHLIDLGHRKIAMISGPASHRAAQRRLEGFLAAMAPFHGAWTPPVEEGDFLPESGHRIAMQLLASSDPPTAIFAANDGMASGVIAAGIDLGLKLPRDLSVVGFDDIDIARYTWPRLTTIRQPLAIMAREAVQYLADKVEGVSRPASHLQLDFRLVVRDSTAPPREGQAAPSSGVTTPS